MQRTIDIDAVQCVDGPQDEDSVTLGRTGNGLGQKMSLAAAKFFKKKK